MARTRDPHPLGKCAEERLDLGLPAELKLRLNTIAHIKGVTPTRLARDILEKAIEGEWVFMQRRVDAKPGDDNGGTTG